jgi:Tfp pilus assembly protein PilO
MLSRLSSRYIAFGVVALSLVFAAAWYFLLYQPGLANAQVIRDEISKLEDEKAVGERARANIAQLCGVVGNLRVQQTAFLRALPRTEDISTLLNELRGTIQGNSAQLNSVSRSAGAAQASALPLPPGVRAISINLGVEGTFGSFYGVLAAVEALQRFSKVETVSLGLSSQGDSFNPKLNAQMAMTTFVYDNPNRDNLQAQAENPLCQSAPSSSNAPSTPGTPR